MLGSNRIASWLVILLLFIGPVFAEWTAFNDCIRASGGDFTAANVTDWTIYNNFDTHNSGPLKDLQSGADLPATVTFTMLNGLATSSGSGANPAAGTDAYAVFHKSTPNPDDWIVDLGNMIVYYGQPGWYVDITFTGLNPSKYYTYIGTAIRGQDYPLRESLFTLSGHKSAENNSSPGVVSKTPTTTVLLAGGNQYNNTGFIVRWDNIAVSDAGNGTGSFTVRAEASPNAILNDGGKAYPFGAFMLQEVGNVVNEPAGDLNGDDRIDLADLTLLASEWLAPMSPADLDGDGRAAMPDLAILASNWQKSWQSGSLLVELNPAAAVSAGAQWRIDDGDWQNSGATVAAIPVGIHTVSFSDATGYNAPVEQQVTIQHNQTLTLSADYALRVGAVQAAIVPQAAADAGAQWRLDGGAWNNGGATIADVAVGSHTVEFSTIAGWNTPVSQTIEVLDNQTTDLTGTYVRQTGSIQVTILPQGAIDGGARWRIDGGGWNDSGAVIGGLFVGQHTVEFSAVAGYSHPGNQLADIAKDQTTTLTGIYTQQTGSLKVTLSPQGAIDAGAQWRVDGGTWQNSGITVNGLAVGLHSVEFSLINGWDSPASQSVTVNYNQTAGVSGAYVRQVGSLQVTLSPQAAIDGGAQWRIAGDTWRASGATVANLPTGMYAVEFSVVSGWGTPVGQSVTIIKNQTTTAEGTYGQQAGSVQVTITPAAAVTAGAQWRVDGGPWTSSGETISALIVGSHMIDFKPIAGWETPLSQAVTIADQQTTPATGMYVLQTGSITVTIAPQGAIDAQGRWRVDGGAWQLSDAIVGGLGVGGHLVEFNTITGFDSPAEQTVQVQSGQTTALTGSYISHSGSITVTIAPQGAVDAGAYWRADNGPWLAGGATLSPVAIGWHQIEYLPMTGWTTPTAQNILVQGGQTTTTMGIYVQVVVAGLTISEFMADNKTNFPTQMTAGGVTLYPDWIEIYNPTPAAVNLQGWSLETSGNRWTFPSVPLESGHFMLVCATGQPDSAWPVLDANGYYHTNFRIDSAGEYLALVAPDGSTVFEYPNGFPRQLTDISYGEAQFTTTLVDSGHAVGWKVPTAADAGSAWTEQFFDDSGWTVETTPLGFGTSADPGMVAYYPMNEGSGMVAGDTLGAHDGTLRGAVTWVPGPLNGALGTALNFGGNYGDYVDIGTWNPSAATGQLSISHWLKWSGTGNTWQGTIGKRDTWSAGDMMWQIELQSNSSPAGYTTFKREGSYPAYGFAMPVNQWTHVAVSFDGTTSTMYLDGQSLGSDLFSFGFDPTAAMTIGACEVGGGNPWKGAIDDVRIYDRALTATEVGRLAEGKGLSNALETQMLDKNASCRIRLGFVAEDPAVFDSLTLRIRYEDGFIAYLNGQKVAERNAPVAPSWDSAATTDRPDGQSLTFEEINLTAYLSALQAAPATNVLAIHGLNNSKNNGEFLIEPVLVATQDLDTPQYFTSPTPGAANISGALGVVDDIEFSHKRGFYTAGFSLALATDTAGAEIRYTLDGSAPTATSGTVYSSPIAVNGTSKVRAVGIKPGWLDSKVKTHTYLFLGDILQQSPTGTAPTGWPAAGYFNGQIMDYGMDPDIVVNDTRYNTLVDDALVSIPTLSLVTDLKNLFDAGTGIYVNAYQDSYAWERPVSLELINPDGTDGFQIDCGLRIRGGYSRSGDNPKHAFRVFFRGEYGEGKLNYPLFGDEGADSFDKIDIQTSQNYSWSFGGDGQNTMCREIFSRDTQRAMGQPYTRSRYYHLYINGQYWGLFLTQERCEARFAETYFGGSKDDYDVVKVEAGPYTINATDGTLDKWQQIFNAMGTFKDAEPYFRFQGMNPDGTRNPAYERLIDVDNLIDYMICTYFVGDFDGPVSNFLGNTSPNNFYGIYNRVNPDGFKFFRHDAEHSLFDNNSWGIDRTGPFPAGQTFDKFNPQYLSQMLAENPEYRVRFGDRVHKYFFNGGALTPSVSVERFLARANTINTAIIAESARWGDSKTHPPLNRNDHWLGQINYIAGTYLNNRGAIVLNQFLGKGWYPNISAPTFGQFGGYVNPGFSLTMSNPGGGELYYTLDGADPRKYSHLSTPGADVTLLAASAAKKIFVPVTAPVSVKGTIRADYWFGIGGTAVSDLTSNANYPDNPGLTEYPTVFETRTDWENTYGARISGYLHPPVSGNYTFWIASDDGGELWLSTTESATNAVKIAQVSTWTGTRQWDRYAEQKSAAIPLTAGQKYYIHALMKEEGGGDNLSVAWQGPGITRQIIDGQNLSPAGNPWMNVVYDETGWTNATGTIGYENSPGDPVNFTDLINTNVKTAMYNKNPSCYIRIPFTAPNMDFSSLTLKVRYDDGFIAYLNGFEVKRVNFGAGVAPQWDSAASASHADNLARQYESFDITAYMDKLKKGTTNVLAIQALNTTKGDSDFLLGAELTARQISPGDPSATATRYTGPVTLNKSTQVKARALNGKWSALSEATFAIGPVKESLRITELMYHPADPNTEYIELKNIGAQAINLNLVKFTKGVDFTFGDLTLAPGAYVLVVQDAAAFEALYGAGLPIAGQYAGLLDNAGERIQLVDALGTVIHDFGYKDGWYDITDGRGFSLTIVNPANPDLTVWGQKIGWRASAAAYGSPASDDSGLLPLPGSVVINEIQSHSHTTAPDWIELHNTTDNPINIGGWFLSDSNADDPNKMKYQIADGTILPKNGYAVFYQDLHFGNPSDPGCHIPFALSEAGETVYLQSGQGGALTGYAVEQEFDAAESNVAFGRYIKSTLDGGVNFVAMSTNTPGSDNAAPKVGPIVFTEIMYNPNIANTGDEYIELKNISSSAVTLQDAVSTETAPGVFRTDIVPWQFTNGIDFAFPANTTIPAGGYLIVAKDLDAFKAKYGAGIPVLQWTAGSLDNGGEKVRLSKPGDQELGQTRYWIRAEQVTYDDVAPWPLEPDGAGKVLQRISPTAYGNDAANWQAGNPGPGN